MLWIWRKRVPACCVRVYFWAHGVARKSVEVKNGETVKVEPGDGKILHVSQASLGEVKKDKGRDPVYLHLKVKNQKFVLATLSHEKFPQVNLDVVFHEEFELSHSFKGSVYFTGYEVEAPEGSESDYDSEEDEELPQLTNEHVKAESKAIKAEPGAEKPSAAKSDNAKKHVNFKEPTKDTKPKTKPKEEDDSDDDDSSSEESSDEEEMVPVVNGEDESSDDDESDEEDDDTDEDETSDDETPKKLEPSKKRPAESALKTPVSDKKAKLGTTQKSAGGHVATPYPSKQGGRKPGNSEQTKQQTTPKSAGSYPCKSCNRSFTSETGLQSHTKAKHSTAA